MAGIQGEDHVNHDNETLTFGVDRTSRGARDPTGIYSGMALAPVPREHSRRDVIEQVLFTVGNLSNDALEEGSLSFHQCSGRW